MKNEMKPSHLVIAVVMLMALAPGAKAQDYERRTRIDTTVRLDRGGAVDLSLISGKIRVTGWDRQDVKVSATIDRGTLRFDANSSRVTLSVDESEDNRGHGRHNVGDARYEVSVPRGSRLILEADPRPGRRRYPRTLAQLSVRHAAMAFRGHVNAVRLP